MLKSYFKIAWRNLNRRKVYTIINVMGLALGISACIVIFLITSYEFSFDRFHQDKERIYRIVGEIQRSSGDNDFWNSPTDDVAGFQHQVPGFEAASGFHTFSEGVTIPQDNKPPKKFGGRLEGSWSAAAIITGPEYFDIFKHQVLIGNVLAALSEPNKVVLSEKRAKQYFGDIPLGKMIGKKVIYQDSLVVNVSAIVKDWEGNTDFGFTDFISISTATHSFLKQQIPTEDWTSLRPHRSMAFVKLSKGTTAAQVNDRFAAFIKEHLKFTNQGSTLRMYLQPLTEIHFTKDFHRGDDGDDFRKPHMPTLYTLMGVALFILVLAIVNFINLSTAQSIQRVKEIGVRKVLGSNKKNIRFQFLIETFMVTLIAMLFSVLLVNPILYFFHDYISEGILFHPLQISVIGFLITVTIVTSLLCGFYPAKVLAGFLPVTNLKGALMQQGTNKVNIRKALIVFQFSVSLIFIIGAMVISNQINYMNKADKGFNSEAVITVNNWGDREGKLKVFVNEVKSIVGVERVIQQGNAPMGFAQSMDNFKFRQKDANIIQVSAQIGNEDFVPFYKMKLIAGRNMLHSDSLNELVINESLAKSLGITDPQQAIGKMLYQVGYHTEKPYPIVGVVADFHEGSFQEAIRPAVIENVPDRKFSVAIKLNANEKRSGEVKTVIAQIESRWKKLFPEKAFDYSFLNESITWLYGQEEKTKWLVNVAMVITIFISCMGLFGLGMFTAQRRTKEISIRKIIGASVLEITTMLCKDFLKLVMIAFIIACPIAWYCMHQWLQDYAFRINISWWVFALAGLSAGLIALITVSFQAIKAAVSNPVKNLRNE